MVPALVGVQLVLQMSTLVVVLWWTKTTYSSLVFDVLCTSQKKQPDQ